MGNHGARTWIFVGGLTVVILGLILGIRAMVAGRDRDALETQLRLARAAGIPTTAAEFAATIARATVAENAAPFYRRLHPLRGRGEDVQAITEQFVFFPSAAHRAAAIKSLRDNDAYLRVVDEAVARPRCWFDRDWTKGMAVLLPEYAEMKSAARYLGLRGSMAADRGDSAAALGDVRRMLRIADHAREEPIDIGGRVADSIYWLAAQHVAWWSFEHRGAPAYRQALRALIDKWPTPDLKKEHRADFFEMRWLLDNAGSVEGLRALGIKEADVSPLERVAPIFLSQAKAKVRILEGERRLWAAFDLPPARRIPIEKDASNEIDSSLMAFPTAEQITGGMSFGTPSDRLEQSAAWKLRLVALLRALDAPIVPRTISTADLKSPYDGKPLSYSYNGRQIVITVSGSGNEDESEFTLKVPPDKAFH